MNQNLNQNNNGIQPPKKDNTLKIVLIIIGAIFALAVIGIIGFGFLVYVIFNQSIEVYKESRDDIFDNYNSSSDNKDKDNVEDEDKDDEDDEGQLILEYSNIDKLILTELKELINEKKSFIIVISQTFCSHCIDYKPKYNEVLKDNNMIGYELDLLTLAKSEYDDFNSLLSVQYTPTTLVYIDGVVQEEYLEGSVTKEEIITFLQKYNLIKK